MTRTFEDKPATRERVPLLVGLVGPSGSGKTYSALRLATGMQRETGGEIFVIDTESRRALHYADDFKFRHIEMGAPFASADYAEAIKHCVNKGAGVLVIDSMSHEHEGPGGYLETHEAELDRMAGDDYRKRKRMTFSAWIKPSAERRRLISEVLRMGVNAIFCFRAKEKLKLVTGQDPVQLGWQPIAGDAFIYEMTINCLMYPGANGVPNWAPDEVGEKIMLKRPKHLASVFKDGEPLSEETGEALALWAAGTVQPNPAFDGAVAGLRECVTMAEFDASRAKLNEGTWNAAEKAKLREVVETVRASITQDNTGGEG